MGEEKSGLLEVLAGGNGRRIGPRPFDGRAGAAGRVGASAGGVVGGGSLSSLAMSASSTTGPRKPYRFIIWGAMAAAGAASASMASEVPLPLMVRALMPKRFWPE